MNPAAYPWSRLINFDKLKSTVQTEATQGIYSTLEQFLGLIATKTPKGSGHSFEKTHAQFCASLLPFIEQGMDQKKFSDPGKIKKAVRHLAKADVFNSLDPSIKVSRVILQGDDQARVSIPRLALQMREEYYARELQAAASDTEGNYALKEALTPEALAHLKAYYEQGYLPQPPFKPLAILELCKWTKLETANKKLRTHIATTLAKLPFDRAFAVENPADLFLIDEILKNLKDHGAKPIDPKKVLQWLLQNPERVKQTVQTEAAERNYKTLGMFLILIAGSEDPLEKAHVPFCASLLPYLEQCVDQGELRDTDKVKKALRKFAKAGVFTNLDPSIKVSLVYLQGAAQTKVAINRLALQMGGEHFSQKLKEATPDVDGHYTLEEKVDSHPLSAEALTILKAYYEQDIRLQIPFQAQTVWELCQWENSSFSTQIEIHRHIAKTLEQNVFQQVFPIKDTADLLTVFAILNRIGGWFGNDPNQNSLKREGVKWLLKTYEIGSDLELNHVQLPRDANLQLDNGWLASLEILPFMASEDALGKFLRILITKLVITPGRAVQVVESLALAKKCSSESGSPLTNVKSIHTALTLNPEEEQALKELFPSVKEIEMFSWPNGEEAKILESLKKGIFKFP